MFGRIHQWNPLALSFSLWVILFCFTNSISLLVKSLFRYSTISWVSSGTLYLPKNLSILSKLSNLLATVFRVFYYNLFYFCKVNSYAAKRRRKKKSFFSQISTLCLFSILNVWHPNVGGFFQHQAILQFSVETNWVPYSAIALTLSIGVSKYPTDKGLSTTGLHTRPHCRRQLQVQVVTCASGQLAINHRFPLHPLLIIC